MVIYGLKMLREMLIVDAMDGMLAKALDHGELTEPKDGHAAVPGAGVTIAVGLWTVTMWLEAIKSGSGAEEGADVSDNNFKKELSAGKSVM